MVDINVRHTRTIRIALAGIVLAAALVAVATPAAYAQQQQDVEVNAEVDKTELAVGEEFTLRVNVNGSLNPQAPAVPQYDGIRRLGPPSMQRQTWIRDGVGGSTVSFFYQYRATEVGKVTIDPISVTVSGETYETESIEVEVFRGLAVPTPVPGQADASSEDASSTDSSMFVVAEVDNDKPYLGEQITFSFKFYRRSVLFPSFGRYGQPRFSPPGFTGFWNGEETEQEEYTETIDGRRYQVVELETIIFPTVVGTLVIEPAGLTVPIDFFESPNYLETDPVVIEVQPLPPAAPAGFTGAVGSFDVTAVVDDTNGRVNEPVQLTVTVTGEGNIETLPDPDWPDFIDWRVFESPSNSSSRVFDGRMIGSRVYETVLVPEKSGMLTVPEIGYTYFDPSVDEYVEAITDPIVMSIEVGDGLSSQPSSTGGSAVERAGSDVRHIKPVPSSLGQSGTALTGSLLYWAAWTVPLIALAGAVALRRRQAASESGRAAALRRNALANALDSLARAGESGADPRVVVADILSDYLSTRLDLQVAGLTHEALDQRLQALGVPLELALKVEGILGAAEVAKYAPEIGDSMAAEAHFERAAQLLKDINEAISA